MTFKVTASSTSLVNRALGAISQGGKTIAAIDTDAGFTAEVARRWYRPVVARLLEMHHWNLATTRAALVAVTNIRSTEWLYAYAAPDDMAFPVGITLESGTSSVSYYRGLAGLIAMAYGKPIFQHHGNTIWSNLAGDLEYVSFNITEAAFTPTFEDIVVLMLASRFALEIPKDPKLAKEYAEQAEMAINVAITQNLNTGGRQYGNIVSEAEMARGTLYGPSWDYYPIAPS